MTSPKLLVEKWASVFWAAKRWLFATSRKPHPLAKKLPSPKYSESSALRVDCR
jgi:hypothetical protein